MKEAYAAAVLALAASTAGCFNCGGTGASPCEPLSCAVGQECNPDTNACEDITCVPGFTRCAPLDPQGLQRCNAIGDGYTDVGVCGPGQTCVPGAGGAVCDPPACAPGAAQCQPDGEVSYCTVGVFEDPIACPSGEVCDATAGTSCVPTVCGPDTMFCEEGADVVRVCNALGSDSTVIEACGNGDVCNDGACVGQCDLAALTRSSVGCVFMSLDTNNITYDDPLQYDIAVANPSSTLTANVVVERRDGAGGAWMTVSASAVSPGALWLAAVPDAHAEGTSLTSGLAYRTTSDIPVVAYQFNSDDLIGASSSSGASILFPTPSLGERYWAMGLPTVMSGFGADVNSAGFAVVGAFDGTNVTVTVSTNTEAAPGIPAMVAGDSYATTLNEGDVLQMEGAAIGDDVTGSLIVADQGVAVFSYHEGAITAASGGDPDHYEEEMLPVEAWGTTFPCARMWQADETVIWRFLADEDATTLTFWYETGVTGLPSPLGSTEMLNAGEWVEHVVDGPVTPGFMPTNGNIGDFLVLSDKPIQIAQWSMTKTSMLVTVPYEEYLPRYFFASPPFFQNTLTVIRRDTASLMLDGAAIPSGMFSDITMGYQAYRSSLADGPHFLFGTAPTELESGVGIHITGESGSHGFAYVGGLNLE